MKKIKQSTQAKILTITSLVLVIICALCAIVVSAANTQLTNALNNKYDLYVYSEEYRNASELLTREARCYAANGDATHYDNYWREVNETKTRELMVANMEAIGITDEEHALIDKCAEISNGLVPLEEEAMNLVAEGKLTEATAVLFGAEYSARAAEVSANINQFDTMVSDRMQKEVDKYHTFVIIVDAVTYFALAITLICQIIVMVFVLRSLIRPIVAIKEKMLQFAQGDIHDPFTLPEDDVTEVGLTTKAIKEFQSFQIEVIEDINYLLTEMSEGNFVLKTRCEENYRGDYEAILLAVRKINRKLSHALSEIDDAFEQVDAGAGQVSSASIALSQGATEQAASIEQLNATIATMADDLVNTAKQTEDASTLVTAAEDELNRSVAEMALMMEAMANIEEKSGEIENIVKTIEDIAFQTNILALNAAIEAARAGDAGKGFAVVADEVRNLAQKSAEAAQHTTQLISETTEAIHKGKEIAESTESAVNKVVADEREVGMIVLNIKETAHNESEAAYQIQQTIEQISTVVQTNSATSEETAAASEQLSAQADTCKKLIDQFNLRRD